MIQFKKETEEPIEIDDSFVIVSSRQGSRLISNNKIAFEIICQGKKRDRLLAEYELQQRISEDPPTKIVKVAPKAEAHTWSTVEPVQTSVREAEVFPDEVNEFLNSVCEPDPTFAPLESEWFDCVVAERLANANVLIATLTNGEQVWVHEREVSVKPIHGLCLPPGTPMTVRMDINSKKNKWRYVALECQIVGEPTEKHGSGTVEHWTGSLGSARMPCGCSIMVATPSRYDEIALQVGQEIEFDFKFFDKKQTHIGVNPTPKEQ